MKIKRLIAASVAIIVMTGCVGAAVFIGGEEEKHVYADTEYNVNSAKAQNLQFKINELWRLGLNSSIDENIKSTVQKINTEFNAEKLAEAVALSGEDFEVAADEYLLSIQLGINFDSYTNDRESYEEEKASAVSPKEILTCAKIDEYLNRLNRETAEKQVAAATAPNVNVSASNAVVPGTDADVPKAEDILPENPAQRVKDEIEAITPHIGQ